jgi:hypothetical protein
MSKTHVFERFDLFGDSTPAADGEWVKAQDAIDRDAVLEAQIRTLETQLKDTKRAALAGMDAAKSASRIQYEEAARLRAESSPEALASERAANAILTEENERLRAALDAATAQTTTKENGR